MNVATVSLQTQMFDEIKNYSNRELVEHMAAVCRMSKKRILPDLPYTGFQVKRGNERLSISLFCKKRRACVFSFVPVPAFN